jgi:hypothetical protein
MGGMQTCKQNRNNVTTGNTNKEFDKSINQRENIAQPQCKIQDNINKMKTRLSTIMNDSKFKLETEQCSPKISIKQFSNSYNKMEDFHCKMKQIQANSNNATKGYKLQGISKDVIVITSWPTGRLALMFKNWEYVVLSRVRTLSGLYLIHPIDMEKSFKPSEELKQYMEYARREEATMLEKRKISIAQIDWDQT